MDAADIKEPAHLLCALAGLMAEAAAPMDVRLAAARAAALGGVAAAAKGADAEAVA